MQHEHLYDVTVTWTGARGRGTTGYRDYERSHDVAAAGRPTLAGSSDPAFRGDESRWNPEQLLVAALSQCHMLWYLHLCAEAGVVVTGYVDAARGAMAEQADGAGQFTEVVLRPRVTVAAAGMVEAAERLHGPAGEKCFIARSVSFPVRHQGTVEVAARG